MSPPFRFASSSRAAIAPFLAMEMAREAGLRAAAGERIIRFDVGQPSMGAPASAVRAAAAAMESGPLGYTDALGGWPLREAIARHYERRYAVSVAPERIAVATGASGAFLLAFLAVFDTGARVAMASPGYPPYRHILSALGMQAAVFEGRAEDGMQLTAAGLERLAAEAPLAGALVAGPANPTGAMISRDALHDLAQAAHRLALPLISDEIYHGLTYEGPATSALEVAPDALVINSFSKYWAMTGWRVGWLVAPEHLIKPIERLAQNLFICAPAPAQAAALAALDAEEECEARRALYAQNRALLLEALPALGLPPVARPDGAFYALLDISRFADDSLDFCRRALSEAGVALTPGLDFDEDRGRRWARLAYPTTPAAVAEGLERLARWLKS